MNPDGLRKKLIQVARSEVFSEAVPYAFEKRIMARLAGHPAVDFWAPWASALWRAAAPCLLITALCITWTLLGLHSNSTLPLSNELENAVLAAIDTTGESW
jgi:hypothetical protein